MDYQNYTITNDVLEATHWIAYEDERSVVKEWVIPGKTHKLIDHDLILTEDGNLTAYYMSHKGIFIIMNDRNKQLN